PQFGAPAWLRLALLPSPHHHRVAPNRLHPALPVRVQTAPPLTDTKKKELVGEFKNNGREWQPEGQPVAVNVHDFPDDAVGKAIPYGIYDVAQTSGYLFTG